MKFSIASKLGLMTTFLVLASVGVVGGLFYGKTTAFLVEHALDDIAGEVHDAGNILQSIVRTDDEDVLILANTPPIQGMLRARSAGGIDKQDTTSYLQWISRLETIFESYLQHKSRYVKIRVIDEQGQELVNLVRKGSTIVPLKGDELQNKAHRPYVRETLKLPIGAVYISEFNLNREHGEVSKPNREVVRIATPIFDEKTAMRAGLVIITAEISDELRVIQQSVVSKSKSKIYITNDRGDYLLHPDQSKTYGFDLGKRYRIQEDIPKLTKLYLPENQDQQITLLPEEDDDWHVINFTKIPIDVSHPERYIAVIMTQDYASIISEQSEVLNDVTLWAILLALAGTALAVIFSIQITRPIKQMTLAVDDFGHQRLTTASLPVTSADEIGILARSFESMTRQVRESQANLRELNDSLEAQIVERTRSLEESETHHRTILEAIADAVITIDVDGIITSFNPAAESIFGYQTVELIGQNVSVLLPEAERQAHHAYMKSPNLYASRIINQDRELEGLRKDGLVFPLELNVTPLKGKHKSGFVGILRDITERKQSKQMLITARDEAENANRAKSQFLSSMSHELRTPLNAIIGFSQLLQIDRDQALNENQKESVGEIFKAGKHLLILINEVLDLARIEAGHIDLSIETVELGGVISEALQLISPLAQKRGIAISLLCDGIDISFEQLPQSYNAVRADRTRLTQVLLNLLSNGIKYNRDNGTLIIECIHTDNNLIRINIKDTGVGLSEEQQTRLFKAFDRLEAENSEIEGTGIGLVITKNIIELMGGSIGMSSQLGEGSTFWIELPHDVSLQVIEDIQGDLELTQNNSRVENEKTVLYIEDNPTNLRLVARVLGLRPNIKMWSAHEPLLGLELAEEHKPDLILLDINLPGMDGFEVLKHLRQREATQKIPVIAVSANAMSKDVEKGLMAGFDDYIVKPIDVTNLLQSVENFLKGEPYEK